MDYYSFWQTTMKYNPKIHHRQSVRLKGYDYSQNGYYFVTICTKDKQKYFGDIENGKMILNQCGLIAEKYWQEIPNHYQNFCLDVFIIMPICTEF